MSPLPSRSCPNRAAEYILALVCLTLGSLMILVAPYRPLMTQGIYIDEHALMQGQSQLTPPSFHKLISIDTALLSWYVLYPPFF